MTLDYIVYCKRDPGELIELQKKFKALDNVSYSDWDPKVLPADGRTIDVNAETLNDLQRKNLYLSNTGQLIDEARKHGYEVSEEYGLRSGSDSKEEIEQRCNEIERILEVKPEIAEAIPHFTHMAEFFKSYADILYDISVSVNPNAGIDVVSNAILIAQSAADMYDGIIYAYDAQNFVPTDFKSEDVSPEVKKVADSEINDAAESGEFDSAIDDLFDDLVN